MSVCEVQKLTRSVDGFLSQNGKNLREGEVLYHLARKTPQGGTIAEIGSWKGKSTIWIGKGSENSMSTIYAIDPHTGSPEHQQGGKEIWTFDEFKQNINTACLSDRVVPIVKHSSEAIADMTTQLDFVFIDGAHDYASVKEDLALWYPKVKEGGMIAFHDSFVGWKGVRKLVHEEVFRSPHFAKVRYIDSITYAIKVEKASVPQRLTNLFSLGIKCIHEKSLKFPQPFKSLIKKLIWLPARKRWFRDLEL